MKRGWKHRCPLKDPYIDLLTYKHSLGSNGGTAMEGSIGDIRGEIDLSDYNASLHYLQEDNHSFIKHALNSLIKITK